MDLELTNQKKYLIAVSGGPDSMALLDMAFHSGVYLEAAHMNYHKRQSAARDEKIVKAYCDRNGIIFHRCDFDKELYKGNFQAAARNARYDFFAALCKERGLDEVLVAHQKDDLIETYLMQKENRLGVAYYGLKERNTVNDAVIYRPLLKYTKQELLDYCNDRGIEYGIDESNLSDSYTRNRIRHHKTDKMSREEKDRLIHQIALLNQKGRERYERAVSFLKKDSYSVSEFMKIPYLKYWLRVHFLNKSDRFFDEMKRQLKESESCAFYGEDIMIFREYGRIHVSVIPETYEYRFDSLKQMKDFRCRYFELKDSGELIEGVSFTKEDFPLTIRTVSRGDRIHMRYGHKRVSRFLIDRKILLCERLNWPVMANQKNEVIFVPGMGCDRNHYCEKQDIFMIKL